MAPFVDPNQIAAFRPDPVFPDIRLVGLQGMDKCLLGLIEVFGKNQVGPFQAPGFELFPGESG